MIKTSDDPEGGAFEAYMSVIPYAEPDQWENWKRGKHPRSGTGLSKADRIAFVCNVEMRRNRGSVSQDVAFAAGWYSALAKKEVDEETSEQMIGDR